MRCSEFGKLRYHPHRIAGENVHLIVLHCNAWSGDICAECGGEGTSGLLVGRRDGHQIF